MFFVAGKNGGNFILSVSSERLHLQVGFDFTKLVLVGCNNQ